MSDETTTGTDPSPGPRARYFVKEGEAAQAVYNLRDATAYWKLGYEEIDEQEYRARLPDSAVGPCLEHTSD
ncbi:hypothetical protein [Streptomyces leeuwenhoekii]|uniref:Uncharacterized protein n=1 Tax=Streptomyces leeuwenhoekii TaxID=1437453 RepID=A0A0F7W0T0_STRLW|nr:hypothetical protein [Streptomyces leeuwenhoekii]KMS80567.1 hypothetical protein ACH49_07370 [Streptomyces leeuwenhoekii]CQR62586.1 Hypothetical Protein sle_31250 [Streptomyces leeuwenhoekii]